MPAATFDTLKAVRDLEAAAAGRGELATKADLAGLRADIYRALWLQAAGIVAVLTALAGIAVALAGVLGGAGP